jgi:four helix bundle protein
MHRYKELEIWKRAIVIAKSTYALIVSFPDSQKYGLTNQMKRAAVSIASNIAEGAGRNGNKEFNQFLGIAIGSMYELETQLVIAKEVGYVNTEKSEIFTSQIEELVKMTFGLKNKLK